MKLLGCIQDRAITSDTYEEVNLVAMTLIRSPKYLQVL